MSNYRFPRLYGQAIDPLIAGLRRFAARTWPPQPGQAVLDIGCGTGAHLAMFSEAGCVVHGVDASRDMVAQAGQRLGVNADLRVADGAKVPFDDNAFDLVVITLVLHELGPDKREAVLREAARVVRPDGRMLVTDFHPGPYRFPFGWLHRTMILGIEMLGGWEHFSNHLEFLRTGGLPTLAARVGLDEVQRRVVGKGTLALLLLARPGSSANRGSNRSGPSSKMVAARPGIQHGSE